MKKALFPILVVAVLVLTACVQQAKPPETTTGPAFEGSGVSASAIAISPDGSWLAAVNPDSGSVSLVALPGLDLKKEIQVGPDPRTLTFSADSKQLYV